MNDYFKNNQSGSDFFKDHDAAENYFLWVHPANIFTNDFFKNNPQDIEGDYFTPIPSDKKESS